MTEDLRSLLEAVANGTLTPDSAQAQMQDLGFEAVGQFAKLDRQRQERTGFAEAIWGPGKTPEQIARLLQTLRDRAPVAMATRITPEVYAQLQDLVLDLRYYPQARICALGQPVPPSLPGTIGILTAGTADIPVAEEAAITAELSGLSVRRLWDVGVAGIHRLLAHRDLLATCHVAIVVAGMEGALPSVVGGLVDCPVIGVPTSIGYGTSFGGVAPLLTMLNSCAAGIGVVNIDNGFGAAILAGQILRTATKLRARE